MTYFLSQGQKHKSGFTIVILGDYRRWIIRSECSGWTRFLSHWSLTMKVKVKFTLEHATKAQRG